MPKENIVIRERTGKICMLVRKSKEQSDFGVRGEVEECLDYLSTDKNTSSGCKKFRMYECSDILQVEIILGEM